MSNTITADLHMQVMSCRVCGEQTEIPRRFMRDQEQLLNFVDDAIDDHRECRTYANDPERAKKYRQFRKRVERLDRPRCNGQRRAA